MVNNFTSFAFTFFITTILLYQLRPIALRVGLVDHPDNRKHHQGQIPLIGGIAIFGGFMLALLILQQPLSGLGSLMIGGSILIIIGILDDFYNIPPKTRLLIQVFVALLMIVEGRVIVNDLGAMGLGSTSFELGYFAWPLTIAAIVMAINAVNMIDGIDGLAGGLTLVTLCALAFVAWMAGLEQTLNLLLLLAVAILAFLRLNLRYYKQHRALVFMGDAGSTFLGFVIVWFLISLSQGEQRAMTPVTALWVFALPLLDTGSITIRRLLKGRSPFAADREHLHHLLLDAGFTVTKTLLIMLSSAIVFAVIGIVGLYLSLSEILMFWAFIGLFVLYICCCWRYSQQKMKKANNKALYIEFYRFSEQRAEA